MKFILTSIIVLFSCSFVWAQKGDVWPTYDRTNFDINNEGKILNEKTPISFSSYFLFINNNEFIHCTGTVTSLYKILSRKPITSEGVLELKVISEADNVYSFFFSKKEKYILILSTDKLFGLHYNCDSPYATNVFDNINK